jgi:hypothetical protein
LEFCPTTEEIEKYDELNEYDLEEASFEEDEDFIAKSKNQPQDKKKFKEKLRKHK